MTAYMEWEAQFLLWMQERLRKDRLTKWVRRMSVVCRSSAASAGCNGDHSTAAGGIDNQFVYQKYSKTQTAV